jgi:hypothetical protein
MSHKAFGWVRGAKEMEREFLDLVASDGTRACDGCGGIVPEGEMIEEEHVYIVSSKGTKDWANFFLCSDCSVRMFEMAKMVRERRRRKPGRIIGALEAKPAPEVMELSDEWNILKWGLCRAKDTLDRQAELEDPSSLRKDYESQVDLAAEKVKDALAELEKLSRWRIPEVVSQHKKEGGLTSQPWDSSDGLGNGPESSPKEE